MRKLILTVMLFTSGLFASGGRYDNLVINQQGKPVAGASIRVCTSSGSGTPCSPTATLWADIALTIPLSNPLTADLLGNFHFYATSGQYYVVQVSGTGITTYTLQDQLIPAVSGTLPSFAQGRVPFGNSSNSLTQDSTFNYDTSAKDLLVNKVNNVVNAFNYSGANFGAKVANAIAALPSTGGTVDACGFTGNQLITSALTLGSSSKPVTLLLCSVTVIASAKITVPGQSSIVGSFAGLSNCNTTHQPAAIIEADASNLPVLIELTGSGGGLKNLYVDGDYTNNAGATNVVNVIGSAGLGFITIDGVTVASGKVNNILIYNGTTYQGAAATQINNSSSCASNGSGIRVYRTGDVFINNTQSENNQGIGYDLECANSIRIIGGDSGGNGHNNGGTALPSVKFYCNSASGGFSGNGGSISGMQIGNSYGNQVEVNGWDTTASAQNTIFLRLSNIEIIGPNASVTTNTVNGIDITDGYGNRIDGTVTSLVASHTLKYGIAYHNVNASSLQDHLGLSFFGVFGTNSMSLVSSNPGFGCVEDPNYYLGFCRIGGNQQILSNNGIYHWWLDSTGTKEPVIGINNDDSITVSGTDQAGAGAGKTLKLQSSPSDVNLKLIPAGTLVLGGYPLIFEGGTAGSNLQLGVNTQSVGSGSINNLALGGVSSYFINTAAGDFTITGFAGGSDGRILNLINTSGHQMTLANESGSSTATNRISTPGSNDLNTGTLSGAVQLQYVGVLQRWMVLGTVGSGTSVIHASASLGVVGAGASGSVALSWNIAFPDTDYVATCSVYDDNAVQPGIQFDNITSQTASSLSVYVTNKDGANTHSTGILQCLGVHN